MNMNITRKVTVNLNKNEIDLFMKALCRAKGIANWAENHEKELPESAKGLYEQADEVQSVIRGFLEWMGIDTEDYIDQYEDIDYDAFVKEEEE